MNDREEKALKDIEQFGCHILHVMGDDDGPQFSYSIGIQKTSNHPELLITGLKPELSQWIINEYNERIKRGESFQTNVFYKDFLENFEVLFKEVEVKYYDEYFGWGKWFYSGKAFKVFQLVYPNTSGIWPWEKEATNEFTWFIPKLYAN